MYFSLDFHQVLNAVEGQLDVRLLETHQVVPLDRARHRYQQSTPHRYQHHTGINHQHHTGINHQHHTGINQSRNTGINQSHNTGINQSTPHRHQPINTTQASTNHMTQESTNQHHTGIKQSTPHRYQQINTTQVSTNQHHCLRPNRWFR